MNTGRPRDYRFSVRHPVKQRLLLRALNEMRSDGETSEESYAAAQMIQDLERLLAMRQRLRKFRMQPWRAPRKVKKSS